MSAINFSEKLAEANRKFASLEADMAAIRPQAKPSGR